MAEKVSFELVSPERLLASQEVDMVVVPGAEGDFGVLKGHAPLISTVRPGVISVYETRSAVSERIFIAGGFAEVSPEGCTVLAEQAVPVTDLDRAAVEQEVKDLAEDVSDAKTPADKLAAEQGLAVAKAKLDAAIRWA